MVDWGVGVRVSLEVGEVFHCGVFSCEEFFPLLELLCYREILLAVVR